MRTLIGSRWFYDLLQGNCVHVRSQIEVGDQATGADGGTTTAGNALAVVDDSQIVNDMDGIVFTLLLTQVTAYAPYSAELTGVSTTVLVGAGYNDIRVVGNGDNDLTGAGLYALHTAGALLCVYTGNAVLYGDGTELADLGAGTEAQTAVRTGRGTVTGDEHGRTAILNALILALEHMIVSAALDHGYLPFYFNGFHTHDLSHLLGGVGAAGGTETDLGFALQHSLGIGLTACEAATAAVGTGESILEKGESFVNLYSKDLGGNG